MTGYLMAQERHLPLQALEINGGTHDLADNGISADGGSIVARSAAHELNGSPLVRFEEVTTAKD